MTDFFLLLPEIFLIVTFVGIVIGEIGYHGEKVRLISLTALIGLAGAFVQVLLSYRAGGAQVFGNVLSIDGLSLFFKLFFILLAILAVVTSLHTQEICTKKRAE